MPALSDIPPPRYLKFWINLFCIGVIIFLPLQGNAAKATPLAHLQRQLSTATFELLIDNHLTGTGFFVTPDGFAMTAAHNLTQAHEIEALVADFGRLKVRPVATDLDHDLALVKIISPGGFFAYLKLADDRPTLEDRLYSYGTGLYRHGLLISGQLASLANHFEWNGNNQRYTEVMYLSAMTPEGFSGAPWVNSRLEVIGVQSGMVAWRKALMGIAFAAPGSAVHELLEKKKDRSSRALGATLAESWEVPKNALPLKAMDGLLVTQAFPGGLAAQAGLKKGDFITALNGRKILYRDQFLADIRSIKTETEFVIDLIRDNEKKTATIRILPPGN